MRKEARWTWRGDAVMLAIVAMASLVQLAGAAFVQIEAKPNIVQTKGAQLIIGMNVGAPIAAGGWLTIDFPDLMRVQSSAGNCREESNLLQFSSCTADTKENQLKFAVKTRVEAGFSYQVLVDRAVTLPDTNITVDPIRMSTSANEFRDASFRADPGALGSAQLKPVSEVVADDTNLLVTIKTANVIPRNGKVHIAVGEYWNQGAIDDKVDYFSSISCDSLVIGGQSNAAASYSCQWLGGNRVELEGGLLAKSSTPAGTVISWTIVGFRNPIAPHDKFEIFTVYTSASQVDLMVDQKLVYVEVDVPAALVAASFAVSPLQTTNRGIVQEENIMDLKFATPTPFRAQCTVEYWFPAQYYDADLVTKVTTGDLFSRSKVAYRKGTGDTPSGDKFVVTTEESGAYKAVKFASCETFRSQRYSESTRIEGLRQPSCTQRTSSIKIYIKDADGHAVAQLEEGLTFQAKRGSITFKSASMAPTTVLIATAVTFSFSPVHGLKASMNPQIKLEFPPDYVVQPACDVTPIKGLGAAPDCAADVVHNTITVSTEMTEDLVGGGELAFSAQYIRVPGSVGGGTEDIVITTLLQEQDKSFHDVDSVAVKARDYLTITPGTITAAVESANDQAYANTFYTIKIKPEHRMPQYSIITVVYPPELSIEDMSLSQTHCTDWKNFPSNQGHCKIFPNRTIIVNKGF